MLPRVALSLALVFAAAWIDGKVSGRIRRWTR